MGRFLSGSDSAVASGLEFSGHYPLHGMMEKFVVPQDKNVVFLSGCAAGGANNETPTSDTYNSGAQNDAYVGLAVNSSGAYLHYYNGSSYTTSGILDPIARKFARRNINTTVSTQAGGPSVFLDNGVVVVTGGTTSGSNNQYSLDWGANLNSAVGGWGVTPYGPGCIAAKPVTPDTPPTEATVFSIAGGSASTVIQGLNTSPASNTYAAATTGYFDSISCAGGYYMAAARPGGASTKITYAVDTVKTPAGWATATVDAANARKINAIGHNGSMFVAVCDSGKIYTATSVTGPWTERASGTGQSLFSVVWNPTLQRWLAIGDGAASTTSADGITWAANPAAFGGARKIDKNVCVYRGWFVVAGGSTGNADGYYSTNGENWTSFQSPAGASQIGAVAGVGCGVVIAGNTPSNCYIIRDFTAPISFETFDTSYEGGQLAVRDSTGKLRYYLAGGIGQYGGSSNGLTPNGSGTGQGGNAKTGHGGTGLSTGSNGDLYTGGSGFPVELVPPAMYGVKLPGGNASDSSTGVFSGAGASSFGFGGNGSGTEKRNNASGPGAGMNCQSTGPSIISGGGAESVIRAAIPVMPGEILYISRGLGSLKYGGGYNAKSAHGCAKLEY